MTDHVQFPSHIASLQPYVPGLPIADLARRTGMPEDSIAKLASNENPLGPSPRALRALADASIDLSRYPDNDCGDLVQALARFHDVPPEWIVVGAGSESVLATAAATLLQVGSKTAFSQYSFQAYVAAARRLGAVPVVVPSPQFLVDLDGLKRTFDQNPALVYIANPGNPTGTALEPAALEAFLRQVPPHIAVLLDEAYFEFLPARLRLDSIGLVRAMPNLLVTRTFSKAYGLAGMRVGYGIAQPALADMLRRVRAPFTVTVPAQVAAAAALDDQEFLARTVEGNDRARAILQEGLQALGLRTLESHTNFVLAEMGDGAAWTRRLEGHGLIVRPVGAYGLPGWLRISIGTPADSHRVLEAIRAELRDDGVRAA